MNFIEEVRRRRTFAIISHPDAGKTTITEKILYLGRVIREAGEVHGKAGTKAVTSDWMAMERERGVSITSSVMQFNYDGYRVNLLDTPGHKDFGEDTYRTLIAADSAAMLIDASMTGNKVKAGTVAAGNFITQDTATPVYQHVLTPTGHAALAVSSFLTKTMPADVSVAANNVVATVELTGNATALSVTGMGAATKIDSTALGNSKPSESNLHGTAQGVSNAATVGATTADSKASGAFSSAPLQKIRQYKQRKESRELVMNMAAEVRTIALKEGVESKDAMQAYVTLGDYASVLMTGKSLHSSDGDFAVGASLALAPLFAHNG